MILINFSHPITAPQRQQIEALTAQRVARIIDAMPHLDEAHSFQPQIQAVLAQVGLDATRWQTEPILINLPGYAPAAACLLAELHGRMGHFPAIVRIHPKADSNPRTYEVAEIINLQAIRECARQQRNHPLE